MKKQKGTAAVLALVTLVLMLGTAGALFAVVTGSVSRGYSAETAAGVESAAQAGLDWGRLRVRRGYCDGEAVFSGASALPPFPDLTVRVSCVAAGTGFEVTSYACTQAACPGTVPLPQGYSERRLTGVYSVGE